MRRCFRILNLIDFNNVSFSYYDENKKIINNILRNVNISIHSGEFLAIIGKNGSGKSTLAKHFNGILLPTSGDVIVDGINTKEEKKIFEVRKKVGLVFQNPDNQIVSSVVEEDVAFGPENLGIPREEIIKRIDFALEAVGMQNYKKHSSYMLSGGQKQRLAIAGILAINPECIVLDEPTSMLDPQGRKEVINTIINLNKINKTTIVLITHNIEEIFCADRVIVMEDGKVVFSGTPESILSNFRYSSIIGLNITQSVEFIDKLNKRGINIEKLPIDEKKCADRIVKFLEDNTCM